MHLHVYYTDKIECQCICMYSLRMNTPDKHTVQAWVNLVRSYHIALTTVESALKTADLPALSWYDVLLELENSGVHGVRPFELQSKLLLPQYGVSRLVERIEQAGYLERVDCEEDGRGQSLVITKSGKKMRLRMWKVYGRAVHAAIGEKLTSRQAQELAVLLQKL